jgi:hypothetical protein
MLSKWWMSSQGLAMWHSSPSKLSTSSSERVRGRLANSRCC